MDNSVFFGSTMFNVGRISSDHKKDITEKVRSNEKYLLLKILVIILQLQGDSFLRINWC